MSFIAALAAIGEGAALAGGALATGAGAIGSGLAAGAGAIGSGLAAGAGAIGSGLGTLGAGAAEFGTGLASGLGMGAGEAGAAGAAEGIGAAGAAEGTGASVGELGFAGLNGGTALTAGTGEVGSLGGGLAGWAPAGSAGSGIGGAGAGGAGAGAGAGAAGTPMGFAGLQGGTSLTAGSAGAGAGSAGAGSAGAGAGAELGFGQGALNSGLSNIGVTNPLAQNMIYGGLKGAAIGAGVGGLGSAITGQDVGKGMLGGALSGGIGGAGGAGLAGLSGTGGALGKIGEFATNHDVLVPAALSTLSTPFVNNALSSTSSIPTDTGPSYKTNIHWAGPKPGTFNQASFTPDLPNPTDYYPTSQGYAGGGILSGLPGADIAKSVFDSSLGKTLAPGLGGLLFDGIDPSTTDLSNLTPEQIQQLKTQLAGSPQPGTTPTATTAKTGGIINLAVGGDVPKYTPAGLPAGLLEGLPNKIQHFAPKHPPADTKYSHPIEMAHGGIADLGSYRSGGSPNLLQGPGDGTSDSIPASIGGKQPARLASGEYVVSSRIVSELGNGSTDAGAKRLDEMVKRIQSDRK